MRPALAALLIAAVGCGGGTDGTPAASPTGPPTTPTRPPTAEQVRPPDPPIEITPVGRGISVTSENQILLELLPEDLVPANPLDLAGRTLMFTPTGGGYTREVRPLDWEEEADDAERIWGSAEVELEHFRFPFAGREWDSFFFGGRETPAAITFGKPIPEDWGWPERFGTMPQLLDLLRATPMISALYKPFLARGDVHVSNLPDRVIVGFFGVDRQFGVYGRWPKETFDLQIVLHSDGRIAFNYGPQPEDPDEAFGDGIVGLFGLNIIRNERIGTVDDPADPSLPAYLDLLETAIYRTSDPGFVLVEFTTRGPIRPVPGRELDYGLHLDTDRPWSDPSRERDDRDHWWSVTLGPDGAAVAGGGVVPAPREGDNRIGFLAPLREIGGGSASVSPATSQSTSEGAWIGWADGADRPVVVEFPPTPGPVDLSLSDSRPSTADYEAFRYPMIRDGVADVSCRIIEVLGDEFDFMAFNSQFRVDVQEPGPAHGGGGYYWGNIRAEVEGIRAREDDLDTTTPCESRLKNTWGYPVWMKAYNVVNHGYSDGVLVRGRTEAPYDLPMEVFAHEIGHTWLAEADYLKDGERRSPTDGRGHWAYAMHTPAPFPWRGTGKGSVMGGAYWSENSDGTFTSTSGWTQTGGFSWLDLYLMGLATPDEVPDMFVLHNLQQVGERRDRLYTAEKEIVTMEQVLAAMGPRNPPSERARKVFNTGFVYFLLPGQEPDRELLREHARYRDQALEHWSHITGGRSQLTSELPGR